MFIGPGILGIILEGPQCLHVIPVKSDIRCFSKFPWSKCTAHFPWPRRMYSYWRSRPSSMLSDRSTAGTTVAILLQLPTQASECLCEQLAGRFQFVITWALRGGVPALPLPPMEKKKDAWASMRPPQYPLIVAHWQCQSKPILPWKTSSFSTVVH